MGAEDYPRLIMAFKSKAQMDKYAAMVKKGTLKKEIFDEWMKGTPKNLPERADKPLKVGKVKVLK
jgi:hypothetical protein